MKNSLDSDSPPPRADALPANGLRRAFLVVAAATGAGAPWMLGGETVRTEGWLLAGAILTCVLGILEFRSAQAAGENPVGWRVARWPLGLGLVFLALLIVQGLNPSHRVILENRLWRLEPLDHLSWMPKSLAAPFDGLPNDSLPYRSTWRYLLIFGTTWIYAAGLALGLTHVREARRFALVLGVNAALLAAVCIVHVAAGSELTLWRFHGSFDFSHSPVFFYKNHNGAYLTASLAVVLGLASSARTILARRVWEGVAVLGWIATLLVDSRVATAGATLLGVLYLVMDLWRRSGVQRWLRVGGAFALLVALAGALYTFREMPAVKRFAPLLSDPGDFLQGGEFRVMLREVGFEMWSDRPVLGWGGGSFLYLFNDYHERVPSLAKLIYSQQPLLNRFYWPTANCDWIEFALEYGAVGALLLTGAVVSPLLAYVRGRRRDDGWGFFLAAGIAVVVAHGFFDYVLRNPAIMILAASLSILVLKFFAGDEPRVATDDP